MNAEQITHLHNAIIAWHEMNTVTKCKRVTNEELHNMVLAQGVPMEHMAFKCPRCQTVQSPMSLIKAGAGKDFQQVAKYVGLSCVGRFIKKEKQAQYERTGIGCDWSLGGLFKIHTLEVLCDGKVYQHFDIATPEEAQALMAAHEGNHERK